jgi:hypothetical protein
MPYLQPLISDTILSILFVNALFSPRADLGRKPHRYTVNIIECRSGRYVLSNGQLMKTESGKGKLEVFIIVLDRKKIHQAVFLGFLVVVLFLLVEVVFLPVFFAGISNPNASRIALLATVLETVVFLFIVLKTIFSIFQFTKNRSHSVTDRSVFLNIFGCFLTINTGGKTGPPSEGLQACNKLTPPSFQHSFVW